MNNTIILNSARKAVLARISSNGRHFSSDDINEMVSITVERFYTKGTYDPSRSSVQTYVSHIAFNVVYDYVKATDKARSRFCSLDDIIGSSLLDSESDSRLIAREKAMRLMQARAKLSPKYQDYFDLISEGHSHAEIASLLGVTPRVVDVTAHRMRRKLMTLMDEVA